MSVVDGVPWEEGVEIDVLLFSVHENWCLL